MAAEDPEPHVFPDVGAFPNSRLPVLIYRRAVTKAAASDFERLFASNRWSSAWRNGLYTVHHYHSTAHEVLGIFQGWVKARLGGPDGISLTLEAGDVVVIPAGVGHECLADDEFLVVGAYPPGGTYDECRGSFSEHQAARKSVPKVPVPKKDPLYGADGGLTKIW